MKYPLENYISKKKSFIIIDPVVPKIIAFRIPSGTWKPGKAGDFNFICPGQEMAWNLSQKVRKPGQNKKFSRKPGMLRYKKFQYYIETIFSMFCSRANLEHLWCLPFGAKILHTITWRMTFLTWTKPRDNLEFYDLNKLERKRPFV